MMSYIQNSTGQTVFFYTLLSETGEALKIINEMLLYGKFRINKDFKNIIWLPKSLIHTIIDFFGLFSMALVVQFGYLLYEKLVEKPTKIVQKARLILKHINGVLKLEKMKQVSFSSVFLFVPSKFRKLNECNYSSSNCHYLNHDVDWHLEWTRTQHFVGNPALDLCCCTIMPTI
jgi:hypothetical protein